MRFQKLLLTTVTLVLWGCGSGNSDPTSHATQMVYVDLHTNTAVVGDRSDVVPAVNPATGERSLMTAELQRIPAARQCPQCGSAMSADGPWPEAVQP